MSIDCLLSRVYNKHTYNCAHLVIEAWLLETGQDISPLLLPLANRATNDINLHTLSSHFQRVYKVPTSHAIALMRRPKTPLHVGMLIRQRILHITLQGVEWMPPCVASRGFSKVLFYVSK